MGSDLSKVSTIEVAIHVKDLALAYHQYEQAIIDNDINGAFVFDMHQKGKIASVFDDIKAESGDHRGQITKHFTDLFPSATGAEGNLTAALACGGGGRGSASTNVVAPTSPSQESNVTSVFTALSVVNALATMAFLTHDWGTNQNGANNHDVVSSVNDFLKANGISTWFDAEGFNNYKEIFAEAIDNTSCIVVFATERYMTKANSNDVNAIGNYEFNYAVSKHDRKIIVVVMEERMRDTRQWSGVFGASLGGLVYVDMYDHSDPAAFQKSCVELKERILSFAGGNSRPSSIVTSAAEALAPAPAVAVEVGKTMSVDEAYRFLAQLGSNDLSALGGESAVMSQMNDIQYLIEPRINGEYSEVNEEGRRKLEEAGGCEALMRAFALHENVPGVFAQV